MRLISSFAIDRFFVFISQISREVKIKCKWYQEGDFIYYDVEEVKKVLKPKAKRAFDDFVERNKMEIHEYGE